MKKILVIDAHPNDQSFCCALAKAYTNSAKDAGFDVQELNLRELKFDPNLYKGPDCNYLAQRFSIITS
jgi:putative NADPH-quinone reductase